MTSLRKPPGATKEKKESFHDTITSASRLPGYGSLPHEHQTFLEKAKHFTLIVLLVSTCTVLFISCICQALEDTKLDKVSWEHQSALLRQSEQAPQHLVFYNRPPHVGSTSIYEGLSKAAAKQGLLESSCFEGSRWNEMVWRKALDRSEVSFHGCRMSMPPDRYREVARMRYSNVTFMTSTRSPQNRILHSYLEEQGSRNLMEIADPKAIALEVEQFRAYVHKYEIDVLYKFHGAEVALKSCPHKYGNLVAMRDVAARYEVVIDPTKPEESANLVEIVTGLKLALDPHKDMYADNAEVPVLVALRQVDTRHKNCGNELVHSVLMQQFNIMKDRLMQNRCFDEATGSSILCDLVNLEKANVKERSGAESFQARAELRRSLGAQ